MTLTKYLFLLIFTFIIFIKYSETDVYDYWFNIITDFHLEKTTGNNNYSKNISGKKNNLNITELNNFVLTIQINKQGVDKMIKYNEKITIVRSFESESEYAVICFTIAPFGYNYKVTFMPAIYEYASVYDINNFNIVKTSIISNIVTSGGIDIFNNQFLSSGKEGIPGAFGIDNQQKKSSLTAGLAQIIFYNNEVENKMPINIASVPYNQTIFFKPLDKIKIFLSAGLSDKMIIPAGLLNPNREKSIIINTDLSNEIIIGKYLEISIESDTTIHFDNQDNAFAHGAYSNNPDYKDHNNKSMTGLF